MDREITSDGPEILSADECRRRLAQGGVGRLALPGSSAPDLRPVNFVLDGDALVVRTGEGRILAAARRGDPVAFEIDGIDRLEHTGWSVVVTGELRERPADDATRALPLRAWASGHRDRFVAISLDSLGGRCIPIGGGRP